MNPEPAEMRVQELVRKLRARGQRMTPQRMAVLRALVTNPGHPSAEQVYREVASSYPMMSLKTVYATIDTLKDLDEILVLEFRNGASRYDANRPLPHPHLVCRTCGRIEDLEVGDIGAMAAVVAARTGYDAIRARLDFRGVCPDCREATSTA